MVVCWINHWLLADTDKSCIRGLCCRHSSIVRRGNHNIGTLWKYRVEETDRKPEQGNKLAVMNLELYINNFWLHSCFFYKRWWFSISNCHVVFLAHERFTWHISLASRFFKFFNMAFWLGIFFIPVSLISAAAPAVVCLCFLSGLCIRFLFFYYSFF